MLRRFTLAVMFSLLTVASLPLASSQAATPPPAAPGPLNVGHAHILPTDQRAAQLSLALAPSGGSMFNHSNGPVLHSPSVYTLFWLPAGRHYTPAASASDDEDYEWLINVFFYDVDGSPLYGLLTQYGDATGTIQNVAHLAGSWVDTSRYPQSGDTDHPLHDADIQAEVSRGIATNNWAVGPNAVVLVYTALDVNSCIDNSTCTNTAYCAYHSSFQSSSGTNISYANMPDLSSSGCALAGLTTSPHGNKTADHEINVTSHEFFEAVTDPLGNAWADFNGYELADKCFQSFGPADATGADVLLAHTPTGYYLQREWSNANSACELQLPPTVTGVTPNAGPSSGGGSATITGTGLKSVQGQFSFSFGPYPVTTIGQCTQTQCQVVIPTSSSTASCSAWHVTATVTGLRSTTTTADLYKYYSSWPPSLIATEMMCPLGGVLVAKLI